jgi:hypothetical protein
MEYLHGNTITGDVTTLESSSMATSHVGIQDTNSVLAKDGEVLHSKQTNRNDLEYEIPKIELKNSKKTPSTKAALFGECCVQKEKLETEKSEITNRTKGTKPNKDSVSTCTGRKVEREITNNSNINPKTQRRCPSSKRSESENSIKTSKPTLTKEQLEEQIKCFLVSKGRELVFGYDLTTQERFYVHTIAEELGLEHESKGEGEQRHIVVRKTTKRVEIGKTKKIIYVQQN